MSDVIRGHRMTDLEAKIMSWREEPLFLSQYTQQEVEEALREEITKMNKWIDELAEKDKPLLDGILNQAFNETLKEKIKQEARNQKDWVSFSISIPLYNEAKKTQIILDEGARK